MMRIEKAIKDERTLKALIGMGTREFDQMTLLLAELLKEERHQKKERKRKVGGGRKGSLPTPEQKLFFILFYMKVYPTFDLAGFLFNCDRSRACRWVQKLLPLLEELLKRTCDLPKRKVRSLSEFKEYFPGLTDLFIDGTERPINRPKGPKNQRKNYSGKKKCHTRKNTIWTDKTKRVLLVSPTKCGKIHDKKQFDKLDAEGIPKEVCKWVDSGYQGVQEKMPNTFLPKKGSKKNPLTPEEKEENRFIASVRIIVENAIGGIKRYGCLTQKLRNKRGVDDSFILIGAGLWNFHLKNS